MKHALEGNLAQTLMCARRMSTIQSISRYILILIEASTTYCMYTEYVYGTRCVQLALSMLALHFGEQFFLPMDSLGKESSYDTPEYSRPLPKRLNRRAAHRGWAIPKITKECLLSLLTVKPAFKHRPISAGTNYSVIISGIPKPRHCMMSCMTHVPMYAITARKSQALAGVHGKQQPLVNPPHPTFKSARSIGMPIALANITKYRR